MLVGWDTSTELSHLKGVGQLKKLSDAKFLSGGYRKIAEIVGIPFRDYQYWANASGSMHTIYHGIVRKMVQDKIDAASLRGPNQTTRGSSS